MSKNMFLNLTDLRNDWSLEKLIFNDIKIERDNQFAKWGVQTHSIPEWMQILGEEFGEACKEANNSYFKDESLYKFRKELIHTIAVGVAIIEGIDNRY